MIGSLGQPLLLGSHGNPAAALIVEFGSNLLSAWDIGVTGGAYQDTAMTTLADADTDPIRRAYDWSGNDNHYDAPSDAARPVRATVSTETAMTFDGSDDILIATDEHVGLTQVTVAVRANIVWNQNLGVRTIYSSFRGVIGSETLGGDFRKTETENIPEIFLFEPGNGNFAEITGLINSTWVNIQASADSTTSPFDFVVRQNGSSLALTETAGSNTARQITGKHALMGAAVGTLFPAAGSLGRRGCIVTGALTSVQRTMIDNWLSGTI